MQGPRGLLCRTLPIELLDDDTDLPAPMTAIRFHQADGRISCMARQGPCKPHARAALLSIANQALQALHPWS